MTADVNCRQTWENQFLSGTQFNNSQTINMNFPMSIIQDQNTHNTQTSPLKVCVFMVSSLNNMVRIGNMQQNVHLESECCVASFSWHGYESYEYEPIKPLPECEKDEIPINSQSAGAHQSEACRTSQLTSYWLVCWRK